MRNFLYDKENKRLVLVAELYPTIDTLGKWNNSSSLTRNSEDGWIFNSLYVWENVKLIRANNDFSTLDHEVYYLSKEGDDLLMHLPSNDCYLIYGGAYLYTKSKP